MNISLSRSDTLNLKGYAVCLLVYYHAVALQDLSTIPLIEIIIKYSGNVCVTVFAFLSVYGMCMNLQSCANISEHVKYFMHRVARLYISYWRYWITGILITILFVDKNTYSVVYGRGINGVLHLFINAFGLTHYFFGYRAYTINPTWWYMSLALYLIVMTAAIWISWNWKFVKISLLFGYMTVFICVSHNEYLQYTPLIYIAIVCVKHNSIYFINSKLTYCGATICVGVWLYYRLFCAGPFNCFADALVAYPIIIIALPIVKRISILQRLGYFSGGIFYIHTLLYSTWPLTHMFIYSISNGLLIFVKTIALSVFAVIFIEKIFATICDGIRAVSV